MEYAGPIRRLIDSFARLPGIGEKTASRLALYVLNADKGYVDEFVASLLEVRDGVGLCSECMTFSERDPCAICGDARRDGSTLCVVGDYKDMVAIESGGAYRGRYHILHGTLSPLKGIGPGEIRLAELVRRVERGGVAEVIVATGFDSEGEATAVYITDLLKPYGVKTTRIASGVPMGSFIEYMDSSTLSRAMEGRREL
ncbi:MAG TPA: recombination protein RecR [Deltaproteobacteria bacterium]|nr:recombination protein RecR [Deltaproteobacteria bacterium]